MRKICLFLLLCLSPILLKSQGKVTVTNVSNAQRESSSMFYALPMTVFDIDIYATKVIKQAGPYWKYAEKYLGVKNAIRENETVWQLNKVVLRSESIPDPNQYYQVTVSGNAAAAFLSLTPDGIIKGVNTSGEDVDLADSPTPEVDKQIITPFLAIETDAMVNSGALFKEAEEASNQIFRLREGRISLITGENDSNSTGSDAKTLLEELDKQEKKLMERFTGKVNSQVVVQTVRYIPDVKNSTQIPFRFSMYRGVIDTSDLSGTPAILTIKERASVQLPPPVELTPEELKKKKKNKEPQRFGFYYRRPGKAEITITYSGQTLVQQTSDIAQLGEVLSLAPEIGERPDTRIVFFPNTGTIKEIARTSK